MNLNEAESQQEQIAKAWLETVILIFFFLGSFKLCKLLENTQRLFFIPGNKTVLPQS